MNIHEIRKDLLAKSQQAKMVANTQDGLHSVQEQAAGVVAPKSKEDEIRDREIEAAKKLLAAIQSGQSETERAGIAGAAREATAQRSAMDAEKEAQTSGSRISPMYWVTKKDFFDATGKSYDPDSAEDKRVFFDLVQSGESTRHPLSKADEFTSAVMRRRPQGGVPKFGTPGARYDRSTGSLALTSDESRARAQRAYDTQPASISNVPTPSIDDVASQLGISKNELLANSEYARNLYPNVDVERQQRDNYANEIDRDLKNTPQFKLLPAPAPDPAPELDFAPAPDPAPESASPVQQAKKYPFKSTNRAVKDSLRKSYSTLADKPISFSTPSVDQFVGPVPEVQMNQPMSLEPSLADELQQMISQGSDYYKQKARTQKFMSSLSLPQGVIRSRMKMSPKPKMEGVMDKETIYYKYLAESLEEQLAVLEATMSKAKRVGKKYPSRLRQAEIIQGQRAAERGNETEELIAQADANEKMSKELYSISPNLSKKLLTRSTANRRRSGESYRREMGHVKNLQILDKIKSALHAKFSGEEY